MKRKIVNKMYIFEAVYQLLGGAKKEKVDAKKLEAFRRKFGISSYSALDVDRGLRGSNVLVYGTDIAKNYITYVKPGFQEPQSKRLANKAALAILAADQSARDRYRGEGERPGYGPAVAKLEDELFDAWKEIRKIKISIKTRADLERVIAQVKFVKQNQDEFCLCYALNNILMLSPFSTITEPVRVSAFFAQCFKIGDGCKPTGFFKFKIAELIIKEELGYYTDYFPSVYVNYSLFSAPGVHIDGNIVGTICRINPEDPHYVAIIPLQGERAFKIEGVLKYFLYLDSTRRDYKVYTFDDTVKKLIADGVTDSLQIRKLE